jgi:hypothetical protein
MTNAYFDTMMHVIFPVENRSRDITVLTVLLANATSLLPGIMLGGGGRTLKDQSVAVITAVSMQGRPCPVVCYAA